MQAPRWTERQPGAVKEPSVRKASGEEDQNPFQRDGAFKRASGANLREPGNSPQEDASTICKRKAKRR